MAKTPKATIVGKSKHQAMVSSVKEGIRTLLPKGTAIKTHTSGPKAQWSQTGGWVLDIDGGWSQRGGWYLDLNGKRTHGGRPPSDIAAKKKKATARKTVSVRKVLAKVTG